MTEQLVQLYISRILEEELSYTDKRDQDANDYQCGNGNGNEKLKEISTAVILGESNNQENYFHRVLSAAQMKNQKSVAVDTKDLFNYHKPIFVLHSDANTEDDYKNNVDYNNPILLKQKSFKKEEEKLPSFQTFMEKLPAGIIANPLSNSINYKVKANLEEDEKPNFDFKLCKQDIHYSLFER